MTGYRNTPQGKVATCIRCKGTGLTFDGYFGVIVCWKCDGLGFDVSRLRQDVFDLGEAA